MSKLLRSTVGLFVVLGLVSMASGGPLAGNVEELFETYSEGALIGQPCPTTGNLWAANGAWADVNIVGTSGVPVYGSGQGADSAADLVWAQVQFLDPPVDEGVVIFSFDIFNTVGIPGGGSSVAFIGLDPGNGQIWTLPWAAFRLDGEPGGFALQGLVEGFAMIDDTFPLQANNVGLHVEATFDLDGKTLTVDYVGLGEGAPSGTWNTSYTADLAFDTWGMHNNTPTTSWDNFRLVPEPATLCLLGLGGLALLRRRR